MDSKLTLSKDGNSFSFKLKEFDQVALFRGSGMGFILSMKRISGTQLELDGASLTGDEDAIGAIWFLWEQTNGCDDVMFETLKTAKESNFFFAVDGFMLEQDDRTRLKMGLNNILFFANVLLFGSNSCMRLDNITGGVSVTFIERRIVDGDVVESSKIVNIISAGDINKDIFVETLKLGGVHLIQTKNGEWVAVSNSRRERISCILTLRIFESVRNGLSTLTQ